MLIIPNVEGKRGKKAHREPMGGGTCHGGVLDGGICSGREIAQRALDMQEEEGECKFGLGTCSVELSET